LTVAAYARVSSGSDEQANALEQQRARLEAAATAHGATAPTWYVDIASGSKDDRPELQRLLSDARAGRISTVLVTRLDRLSRSSSHGAELLRFFQQDNTPNLIALDDSLDLSTPGGRFMARLLISWAEAESDRLAERVRHGAAYRRSKLAPLGRQAPYGYRFTADRNSIEPDPERWTAAKAIAEHFLEHANLSGTITYARDAHGVVWGSNYSLRRWLVNPALTGCRCYGQSTYTIGEDGKRKRIDNPPGAYREVHPDQHPALITREQHAYAMSVFHANALAERRSLLPGRVRICTGLVTCEHCGHNLVSRAVMTKQPYIQLRCQHPGCSVKTSNAIREETVVMAFQAAVMVCAEALARDFDELQATRDSEPSAEVLRLREEISRLEGISGAEQLLDNKRQELEMVLLQGGAATGQFLQESAAFRNPQALLKVTAEEPAGMRLLFQRYFRVVVGYGQVSKVKGLLPSLERVLGGDGQAVNRV
jgi:DNA invertase Pin-like site-specific DNA recombinase